MSDPFSFRFFLFYGLEIFVLAIFALAWQQVLKRLPLVTAYANRAVTIVWSMLWGHVIFGETVSLKKVIGAAVIILGIVMAVKADE